MLCPNCGAGGHNGKLCVHCHYSDGEEPFRPWWMSDAHWNLGRKMNWNETALKKAKRIK